MNSSENPALIRSPIWGIRFCSCGQDISNYRETAKLCMSCRRKASPMKTCKDCGCEFRELNATRCPPCHRANYVYRNYASGKTLAGSAVAKARKQGILAAPSDFPCTDCGGVATEYDHRSYDKPLDVAPVCRGCNARRGAASRKDWSFDEFWSWFQLSVTKKKRSSGGTIRNIKISDFAPTLLKYWPELSDKAAA